MAYSSNCREIEYEGGAINSPCILHSAVVHRPLDDNEQSHPGQESDNENEYLPSMYVYYFIFDYGCCK